MRNTVTTSIPADGWSALGGLRFFLAFVVFAAHFRIAGSGGWLEAPVMFGALAAILSFLFISGFSIAHSLDREAEGFYLRRFARIMPVHLLTLGVYSVLLMKIGGTTNTAGGFSPPDIPKLLLNLALLNGTVVGPINGPTWSLSCEVFFYALAPFLLRLIRGKMLGHALFLTGIAASGFLYFINPWIELGVLPNLYHGLAMASLFWAWGAGFYLYFHRNALHARALVMGSGVFLLSVFNFEGGRFAMLTFVATAFLLIHIDHLRVPFPHARRLLNYIGDLSFPLYLCHFPLIVLLNGMYGWQGNARMLLVVLVTSVLLLHLVDRPARRAIAGATRFKGVAKVTAMLFMACYVLLSVMPRWE